ncbi:MAG TPA: hypothetical protein VM716_03660 [Gemmatimonadales bacterium]|nr:hypothetical protein [Gemmatimonadales bacterium]
MMRPVRAVQRGWGIAVFACGVTACETARNPGGIQRDVIPPTIVLTPVADTEQIASGLSFRIAASDNLSLKDIRLTYSGGYIAVTDTVFNQATPSFNQQVTINFPANSGAGGQITITGRATDGAGNFAESTITIFLSNVQALTVTLLAPTVPALASTGKNIQVQVEAKQLGGVERVGFIISPRAAVTDPTTPPTDSIMFTPPARQPPDTTYTDTLTVNAGFTTFTVTGFAQDAGGRRALSNTVTVNVQTPGNDVTPPTVSHTISSRVEVNDGIDVHATDPSGISWIGFRVDTVNATGPLKFDTVNVGAANLTTVDSVFSLALPLTDQQLPKTVIVRGYACDLAAARNCAYSQSSVVITGTAPRRAPARASAAGTGSDTVVVVAGITRPLPFGGHIADAIYNTNRRELYLTNDQLGRVEVYSLATNSFDPTGIVNAGPTPWGIALWPRDTLGNYANDTIVVADAGGTELSILSTGTRTLLWRQPLPNFLIEKFSLVVSNTGLHAVVTVHDVSDRPQYLGTVCRVGAAPNCAADSIYAIYSTTPTQSSSSPFNGRATLRMTKLINTSNPALMFDHLFWELGDFGRFAAPDTLRIEMLRPTFGVSNVVLTSCRLVTVDLNSFGLGDQTFVRNTGNFTHGFIGEGGNVSVQFARVFAYSAKKGLITPANSCNWGSTSAPINDSGTDDQDFGMSPGVQVSDFISNTGTFVSGIATNFNGLTNLVRAKFDSIYYLDDGLRLWGTTQVGSGTPGMDMNYNHAFQMGGACTPKCGGGSGNLGERMVFAASPDTSIRVFDTWFFNQQKRILIRDPIIGPLRVSLDTSTGQQYLFGITARGLVVVTLPTIANINPQAPPRR